MPQTRMRELVLLAIAAAVISYIAVLNIYRWFPPLTMWTGLSLAAVALAEAGWAFYVRAKVNDAQIGVGAGRLHPIAVARTVVVAQASAWVGALVFGWWVGVLAYLLPRRGELRVAAADTPGALVAAVCALALVVAALWLQHCCKSPPQDPSDGLDAAPE
jgi:Protein of unknown function (DUF3180)